MASRWLRFIFQLPGDERLTQWALEAFRRAARPGRSPCSMSSSDAPPPVDTWSTPSSRPNLARAAALSPPPTMVKPGDDATALARAMVPSAKRGSSNRPMGPFQKRVPARRRRCRRTRPWPRARCRGPSSRRGRRRPTTVELAVGAEGERRRSGRTSLSPPWARRSLQASTQSACMRESPTPWPWAMAKVNAHGPADDEGVDLVEQGLDDAQLVAHLGPAEDGHERAGGVVEQAAEDLDLLGQEASGGARAGARGGPTTEACDRWDAPKASFT